MRCTDMVQWSLKCMQDLLGYLLLHDKQHCNIVAPHTPSHTAAVHLNFSCKSWRQRTYPPPVLPASAQNAMLWQRSKARLQNIQIPQWLHLHISIGLCCFYGSRWCGVRGLFCCCILCKSVRIKGQGSVKCKCQSVIGYEQQRHKNSRRRCKQDNGIVSTVAVAGLQLTFDLLIVNLMSVFSINQLLLWSIKCLSLLHTA